MSTESKSAQPSDKGSIEAPVDEDMLLDHEYDGILEYDNPMPRWWKAIFWGSFVFSIGYFFWYHMSGNGTSVEMAYAQDVAEANERASKLALKEAVSEESLAKLTQDAAMMQAAEDIFTTRCAPCHAEQGQGSIGPNLTDKYWIHGNGALTDIYGVIKTGVQEKGMPPWERQLSPAELRQIAAFVGTLRGKEVPGKEPQGQAVEGS